MMMMMILMRFFSQMLSKERIKKREEVEAFGSIPDGTERSHSFLLALKSRVIVAKERRRKAKTIFSKNGLPSYLFRCFFALRARQPFRHQSSQHFLSLFIFLVRFLSREEIDFSSFFHPFSGRCVWLLHSLQSKISLSLSLPLSLSIIYTHTNTREEEEEEDKILFKTGGGRLEESLFFSFFGRRRRRRRRKFAHHRKLN